MSSSTVASLTLAVGSGPGEAYPGSSNTVKINKIKSFNQRGSSF